MDHSRLCVLAFVAALAAQPAAGATINVPADQPTIQAGVTAASAGDTVLVANGTYVENVSINKNITLLSVDGRVLTTIQGISNVGALGAITATSNTTALQIGAPGQGFTIEGIDNGNPAVENAALYFQGSHSDAQVRHNEIQAIGDHGLLTEFGATISGFVIDNNLFTGSTFIGLPDGNGFADQFTQPNRPRQLVTMGGGSGGGNTSNITFTNNQVTGSAGGYNPAAEEQGNTLATIDSNGATITGNTFAGTTSRFATSLRCRGPATTISGNTFSSTGIEYPLTGTGHVYMQNIGTLSAAVVAANAFNKVVNVDAPVTTIGWNIQAFVTAVPGGTTIEVGAGTYVEQVVIDGKNVTLQGDDKSTTFIHSPASLATTFTTSGPNKPIITAMNSDDIRISGFTIDGLGLGNANNRFEGVAFWNAGGALLNSCVKDIDDTPQTGVQHGVGIFSFNNTGGPYALEVGNCDFTGYQKNGMALSGTGMVVDVHDCTTTGSGDVTYIAQNGIQVSFGAGGTVTDCTIADMRYTPATAVSSGLLTFSAGSPVVSSGNILITDTQAPVSWYDTDGTCGGCEIPSGGDFNAIFVHNSTTAAADESRPYPQPYGDGFRPGDRAATPFSVSVIDGCLTGSLTAATEGIYALASVSALDLTISNMRIEDWDTGIFLDGLGVTCTANSNSISGNLSAGLDNSSSGSAVDAEVNWWGAADGPSGDGAGSGDAVVSVGGEVDFDPYLTDGSSSTTCAFTPTANTVTPDPGPDPCISTITPCIPVAFDITRSDNADMRAFSVTFTLSTDIELCNGLASITEGTYLNAIGGTNFQKLDNGGGSYTVDGAILGLPCGQTAASGTLFDIEVQASGGDGTGTITVTEVILRDCVNTPLSAAAGAAAIIPVDGTPPTAVGNLAAAQVKAGNDSDGTTKVTLTFTAPGDASTVEVYRAPYSDGSNVNAYPEYDDAPGGAPPATPTYPPPAPWALTGVTATGQTDETSARGFWYYVVFTKDDCDNVSAVSNQTTGTLNYHLGDVHDGIFPGTGDNLVATADMSHLGTNYGATLVFNDPVNYLDVGPTSDFSVDALPDTDDEVEFEDLMMFAINFGQVARDVPGTPEERVWEAPSIALEVDDAGHSTRLTARLILHDNVEAVKGIHSVVSFDRERLELIEVRQGELLDRQGLVFFAHLDHEKGALVDAAVMGRGRTISGSGEIAELQFRVLTPGARPSLVEEDLRDRNNGPAARRAGGGVEVAGKNPSSPEITGVPARIELVGARPNPFGASTEIVFRLPRATEVSLKIYDVSGRLVRTLVDRVVAPGEVRTAWDGRTNDGKLVNAGVYFYTFRAAEQRETRKITRFR